MSKWIVFITVVHEEMTFSADLRSEGERSVATYPLLAVPTTAIAELVVARLNHQHGLPEEAGTDDWQEFSFKAESELTPQEVAMALDLDDPAYPKNKRHPSWLSEMVTAAKTAMAQVVKQRAAAPHPNDPAYLFVGTDSSATPSTVFHRAGTARAAETLRRLFAKEYSATGTPAFNIQPAGVLPPDERLLLDEAIDELAVYDDPDPGVYDPPASKELLARAEYARRADRWEAMLHSKGRGGVPPNGQATQTEVLVFIAESGVHFGDTRRVLPSNGAVVASISGRALAEAVADMYRVERGDDALPLVLVERSVLSVTQVALATRELSRAESIGSNLGSDDYSTSNPTFARIGSCAVDLARLAAELRPVVEGHESQNGTATGRLSARSPTLDRVNDLLRAVERHRLMFLSWAAACRRNPLAVRSRSGVNERVLRDEIRGWSEMVDAIDTDGTFLWTHRDVLDRYAQEAIGTFGPGEGKRPSEPDADGRGVPVEGGTLPYWLIDDGSTGYLEQSSDAILDACRALAETGRGGAALELVKDASSAARPEGHARWYTNIVVQWSYLSTLDSLVSRIKTVRVELAMPPRAEKTAGGALAATTPDAQSVADVVVLFMVARDLVRIGRDYPDAMPEADHKAWVDEVTAHADMILKRPGFEGIKALMKEPTLLEIGVPERFGILMSTAMMAHPAMAAPAGTPAEIQAAVGKAMSVCQDTASPDIKEQVSRLANLMVVSCRCPTGTAVKDFAEPARFLHMLNRYWRLASDLVQTQSSSEVGFNPHPLLHIIENVRDRLRTCFGHLRHLDDAAEAEHACDQLVGMLTEGDIDDLSAVPEWTNGELQKVERFIARARMKTGGREFALTAPEEFFIKQCEHLIAEHGKRVKAAWKQVLANVDTTRRASETATPPAPKVDAMPTFSAEHRAEKIGALLSALVGVDERFMGLGARVQKLSVRGTAANTYALTTQVQGQLHKWIDPILALLNDAETASTGVGPLLNGLVSEPLAWEVETRLAIRSLKDHLVGFIYSNGGENEEAFVNGGACELVARGQRLQAAHEALLAVTAAESSSGRARESTAAEVSRPQSVASKADADREIRSTPLTADHETILTVLAKSPAKCKTVIDVAGLGPIRNRETVGRLLAELAGFGLVDRPHGKRKGYALTQDGLKRLADPRATT